MSEPRVAILGAGPAGVGAAFRLHAARRGTATVLEQQDRVGGNAGSFDLWGQRLDYGSHRLHPASDPAILAEIRQLMGEELLDRPRHGRIRLCGRWIHFPLQPLDLFLRLDLRFAAGMLRDMALRALPNGRAHEDTFAGVLRQNLGGTICEQFYFPYARKIWGRAPEQLSGIQARRRVSAGSFTKLIRKVLSQVPGMKPPGAGQFYYPRRGYGAICEAYHDAARAAGAEFLLGWRVSGVERPRSEAEPWRIVAERDGEQRVVESDLLWSTIPITLLARLMRSPTAPAEVLEAAASIEYRSMMLLYLRLPVDRFTEFDAHYFPETEIAITRLSEPKNYAALAEPRGQTVLCAELPCSPDDAVWQRSDEELGELVARDLERAGIPLPVRPNGVHVRRLRFAYPIYRQGYEGPFGLLDSWADSVPRLLSYGRQGLFAHDNTHHALYMAYSAVDCVEPDGFDRARWARYRREFESHVVED